MLGINKVILIGYVGQTPTVRYTQTGQAVAELNIATHRKRTTQDSPPSTTTHTEWHNITCFQRLAEIARDQLHKGTTVYIEGRLYTDTWTDKNNQPQRTTKIVAQTLVQLSPANQTKQASTPAAEQPHDQSQTSSKTQASLPIEDLPF